MNAPAISPSPVIPMLDIAIESEDWQSFDGIETLAESAIGAAARLCGEVLPAGSEVSILLCDDAFIQELNKKWRGIDKPTNVLSFPGSDESVLGPLLGDIVVAFGTARSEAEDEDKSFHAHVAHLLVHGFLHLIGYDHLIAAEAEDMEALERAVLSDLGIDDPYEGAFVQIAES